MLPLTIAVVKVKIKLSVTKYLAKSRRNQRYHNRIACTCTHSHQCWEYNLLIFDLHAYVWFHRLLPSCLDLITTHLFFLLQRTFEHALCFRRKEVADFWCKLACSKISYARYKTKGWLKYHYTLRLVKVMVLIVEWQTRYTENGLSVI